MADAKNQFRDMKYGFAFLLHTNIKIDFQRNSHDLPMNYAFKKKKKRNRKRQSEIRRNAIFCTFFNENPMIEFLNSLRTTNVM